METHKYTNNYSLKHAFDYAAIGGALLNLDGSFIEVNPAFHKHLKYKKEEVLTLNLLHLIHPDDLDNIRRKITKLLNGDIPSIQTENRYIRKDNSVVWASLSMTLTANDQYHPPYFVCYFFDITERKIAERKLITSERRYKQIINETPEAVLIVKDKKCLFINDTGVRLLGAGSKDAVIGQNVMDFLDKETKNRLQYLRNPDLFTKPFGPVEGKIIRYDGEKTNIEIKSIPTIYHGKKAVHTIVTDITERKKTQELIINTEKLTIAGQLAAGIAHEIKNPLTAIKGFMQLIESSIPDKKAYFKVISQEMNRIETILNELLILAKPQTNKFEQKHIETILNHVVTLSKALPNLKDIHITQTIEADLPAIFCCENQLKQVFINFVKNAVEAMPGGGEIHIEAKKKNQQEIIIHIADQGCGIPEHIRNRLGEPFFTTKESGTGLGLMISRQIIESHNGTLHFGNADKGTIVEVTLPSKGKL